MITARNLTYTYPAGKKMLFPDFKIAVGGQCLLLGESGSGKTTLLHLLGGILKSQQGDIQVNDINLTQLSESALDRFRGQHFGFIFQKNHLIAALTVRKNLLLAPFLAALPKDESRINELLQHLDLADKADADIRSLSHGEAQRVAIARAVLNKPTIILADEPTSALDDRNCDRVFNLLSDVARENGSTLLIATHDQRLKNKIQQQIVL